MTDSTGEQGSLFDLYSELAQPEDCIDCHTRLDGHALATHWEYCEFCGESVCGRAGLAAARKLERVGGRKRRLTDNKIKAARRLLTGGTPPRDMAETLGVSVPTRYRWLPASART